MKGLTSKIIISIGGILLVLFLTTGIIITSYNSISFQKKEQQILKNTNEIIAEKVGRYFDRYITIVETMATDQNVLHLMETAHQGDSDSIEQNPYFQDVTNMLLASQKLEAETIQTTYVADVDASVLFDSDLWISGREGEAYDVTTREWYQSVSEKRLFISNPYEDINTKNQVVTISAPVFARDGKEVLGITAVDIEISKLTNMVQEQKLGKDGFLILCSPDNIILSHKEKEKILKNFTQAGIDPIIINAIQNQDTSIKEYQIDGVAMIGSYQPIKDTGWNIISAMPKKEFYANTTQNIVILICVYASCMILMLLALFFVARIVVKPLKKLTKVTDQLAAGNLDVAISIKSKDEVGSLAISLESLIKRLKEYIAYINEIAAVLDQFSEGNLTIELKQSYVGEFEKVKLSLLGMSETMRKIMRQILEAANEVNIGSTSMSEGAQALASSTTQQAASVEEITAAIQIMANQIATNAQNTKKTSKQAEIVGKKVEESNQKMKDMVGAIHEINEYARQIGNIIATIEDIASQTNMLALNAAVEASRAGETGRGFVVIADNVRELASKSAQAAKDTTALIQNTMLSVQNGTKIAGEGAKTMTEVVSGTQAVVTSIEAISISIEEGAKAIARFEDVVKQVQMAVENNSATAEESAAGSQELSAQVQVLKELVNHFK